MKQPYGTTAYYWYGWLFGLLTVGLDKIVENDHKKMHFSVSLYMVNAIDIFDDLNESVNDSWSM